jgi:hypothetical protein
MLCVLCLGRLPVHVLRPGGVHHEQRDDDPQSGGPGAVAQRLPTQRMRQGGEGRYCTYQISKQRSPFLISINPILYTWFRDSCFTCGGSSTIQSLCF